MAPAFRILAIVVGLFAAFPAGAAAPERVAGYRQIEIQDPANPARVLGVAVFYPARKSEAADPVPTPFFTGLAYFAGAEPEAGRHPLVLFSHGRGSNPLYYAWITQLLALNGYVVAAPWHYKANTFDASIAYLANKLWQRPKDLSMVVDALLASADFEPLVDRERIGVAGHSQGGFTALWLGGARVDPKRYAAFQQGWARRPDVPAHLRAELTIDPAPALGVHDPRIRAAYAMAPGIIQAFGMTESGLGAMTIPVHISVGAADTQTPPGPNGAFAAAHIPGAELTIIPGDVDHEIFVNECDQDGRDEFPEACQDRPGVDRPAIHARIGEEILRFFGTALR